MDVFSDDELAMMAIALDEEEMEPPKKQRRFWVHEAWKKRSAEGEFWTLYKELQKDEHKYWEYFRMSEECFESILKKIEPLVRKQDTHFRKAISARERLAVCLRYLATGDSLKTISFSYRLGVSTVHEIVNDTCRAIVTAMMEEVMPTPTEAMWKEIANDFTSLWGFPHCIGALDGKHVTIQAPPNSGSLFYNYKKTYSIVLLALVDAHGNFISVDVGSYGKNSDGGIFAKSQLGRRLEQREMAVPDDAPLPGTNKSSPFVIVGDEAFPLKTYLMRPYPGLHLDESKRVFNYRLSLARRIAENAFGMLAAWCRMYHRTIHASPENIDYMILASCVLHNYIRRFHGSAVWYNRTSASIATDHMASSYGNLPSQGGNASRDAFHVRETLKEYFNLET